jgi:FkbM family methyltransferase
MDIVTKVHYNGHKLFFPTPNGVCKFRAVTFNTKEPETLDWLDCIPEGDILWDVGANIALYSVYAAKARKCNVYAFEPSVFNLELLARSINLNKVSSNVCICPLPLSDNLGSNDMHMASTDWGGAKSTFGENYGFDGKIIKEVFRFQTIGLTMVDAVKKLGIPKPDFIKIDVDGIEHLILGAGFELLKSVKSVLVEVNDDFEDLALGCQKILENAGLVLEKKLHSEMFDNSESYGRLYNQIWIRP